MLKLRKLTLNELEAFQGIQSQSALICHFDFGGKEKYVMIAEPSTVQVHCLNFDEKPTGVSSEDEIFVDNFLYKGYAKLILKEIDSKTIESIEELENCTEFSTEFSPRDEW